MTIKTVGQSITEAKVMTAIVIADSRFQYLVGGEYALICDTIIEHKNDPKAMYKAMEVLVENGALPRYDEGEDELYFIDHIIAILGYKA